MRKMILAVVLLLCFVLVAASCTPNDNPAELKTNENGTPVTQDPNHNGDANNNNNSIGGIQVEDKDQEEGFGELIPLG